MRKQSKLQAIGMTCALLLAVNGAEAAPLQKSVAPQTSAMNEDASATELARQAKMIDLLEDKVAILNHRIEELEQQNQFQSARIEALVEAEDRRLAELSRQMKQELADRSTLPSAPQAGTGKSEQDQTKNQTAKAPAKEQRSETKTEAPAAPEKERYLAREFEQFLDLGEAMFRRFFGLVKEFKRDFEETRV